MEHTRASARSMTVLRLSLIRRLASRESASAVSCTRHVTTVGKNGANKSASKFKLWRSQTLIK